MKIITEGKAKIKTYLAKEVSKDMPVFYNPVMKFNRDMSVLLLESFDKKQMQVGDALAGTGIRSARLLTELKKGKIKSAEINDNSKEAVNLIKKNIELNQDNLICDDIEVSQLDANQFLLESSGFDYIDIDPFGSPNPFLDSAVIRLARDGILAVTATDTAPLAGTYPKTCLRKYWATPIRNEHMHEIGLRILIRKVQLIGAQYEKALTPIFSYFRDHYFRVFFLCKKSKTQVDEVIKKHEHFHYCNRCTNHLVSKKNEEKCCDKTMDTAGPLWTGELNDREIVKKMIGSEDDNKNKEFLQLIYNETKIRSVGFHDLHKIAKKHKIQIPRTEQVLKKVKGVRTHFSVYGVKTNLKLKELLKIITKK